MCGGRPKEGASNPFPRSNLNQESVSGRSLPSNRTCDEEETDKTDKTVNDSGWASVKLCPVVSPNQIRKRQESSKEPMASKTGDSNWLSANYTGGARYGSMSGTSHREYSTCEEIMKTVETEEKKGPLKRNKNKALIGKRSDDLGYTGGSRFGSMSGAPHREYASLEEINKEIETEEKRAVSVKK